MIKISASAKRAFLFPADMQTALTYYGDLNRIASFLPHIVIAATYSPTQFRMHYSSVELATYTINIFCDLESVVDRDQSRLIIRQLNSKKPVRNKAGLHSATGQGLFASETIFQDLGEQSRLEYHITLSAQLPRPHGLRLMPGRVVNRIVTGITNVRVREIADGFIENSINAFPRWVKEASTPA